MNETIYQDSDWVVDIVPSVGTLNNTRFGRDEEVIGEVPGVLTKTQVVEVINLLDYAESLGKTIARSRFQHCLKSLEV